MTQVRVPTRHFRACFSWLSHNMSSDEWYNHPPHVDGYTVFEFFQDGCAMEFVFNFWPHLENS
jgi:hypothetical protein